MQIITGSGKGGRQGLIAEQDLVPQMRKQLRNNAKRSNDKKERSPPVHGNHSALYQLAVSAVDCKRFKSRFLAHLGFVVRSLFLQLLS